MVLSKAAGVELGSAGHHQLHCRNSLSLPYNSAAAVTYLPRDSSTAHLHKSLTLPRPCDHGLSTPGLLLPHPRVLLPQKHRRPRIPFPALACIATPAAQAEHPCPLS